MFCSQLGLRESRETPDTSESGPDPWVRSQAADLGVWVISECGESIRPSPISSSCSSSKGCDLGMLVLNLVLEHQNRGAPGLFIPISLCGPCSPPCKASGYLCSLGDDILALGTSC